MDKWDQGRTKLRVISTGKAVVFLGFSPNMSPYNPVVVRDEDGKWEFYERSALVMINGDTHRPVNKEVG